MSVSECVYRLEQLAAAAAFAANWLQMIAQQDRSRIEGISKEKREKENKEKHFANINRHTQSKSVSLS